MFASHTQKMAVGLILVAFSFVLDLPSSVFGQCTNWKLISNASGPNHSPNGGAPAMAFDGHVCVAHTQATWVYAGKGWSSCSAGTWPTDRPAMAFHQSSDRVIQFGGDPFSQNQTWIWDGAYWDGPTLALAPPGRANTAMAGDSARGEVVLFGGNNSDENNHSQYLADTWVWDGTVWIERHPLTSPPARYVHAMAYDTARRVIVLFGGETLNGNASDTWEWDGTTWTQRTPVHSPPPRTSHAMAYDQGRRVTVLFGGYNVGTTWGDMWEWDGQDWVEQSPSVKPSPRSGHAMAYDARRSKIVLFGGTSASETWEYPESVPPRILTKPINQSVCLGDQISFSVIATGDPQLTYQWRRNGDTLNLPGATTPTVVIPNADFGSAGNYDVVITNSCGPTVSEAAVLSICAGVSGCPSPVDVNGDGVLNGADIQRIVEVLLGF